MATKVSKDRYKSSVFTGYDAEGKRKYKVFYAPTADEADYLALEYKLHKNQPEFILSKLIDIRISAALRDPRIHQFDHQINQLDILLHHSFCFRHMSGIPLNFHVTPSLNTIW